MPRGHWQGGTKVRNWAGSCQPSGRSCFESMRSDREEMRLTRLGLFGLRDGMEGRVPKQARNRPISGQPASGSAWWQAPGLWVLLLLAGLAARTGAAATLPLISVQPQSQTAAAGAGVNFTVAIAGEESVHSQWRARAAPMFSWRSSARAACRFGRSGLAGRERSRGPYWRWTRTGTRW